MGLETRHVTKNDGNIIVLAYFEAAKNLERDGDLRDLRAACYYSTGVPTQGRRVFTVTEHLLEEWSC